MLTRVAQPEFSRTLSRRPTMRHVAALAGVSLRTVSRVINNDHTVAEALQAKVQAAVDQLNYRPNLMASHVRRRDGRSFTVGLLIHDVANPFLAKLQRAVQEVAHAHGCDLLAASGIDSAEREREVVERLIDRRVEGLVIMPVGDDHGYLQADQMSGTVVVFVDRPPVFLAADSVLADNRRGAARGVRHLLSAGHRRVAYLGYRAQTWTNGERFGGYVDALRSRGVDIDPALVRQGLGTAELAEQATVELMTQSGAPTALFTAQSSITIGAVRALRALKGYGTTGLVGFDDFDTADLLDPGVTVVTHDPVAMGSLATEILFQRLEGDRSPTSEHVLRAKLVERGSGEVPAEP